MKKKQKYIECIQFCFLEIYDLIELTQIKHEDKLPNSFNVTKIN